MSDFDGGLDGRLAEGTQMTGTLKFERAVQIDGRFEGNVKSRGKLILGPAARVDAEIDVGELEVQGTLRGKVTAKDRLVIRDGGLVEANIVAGRLAIEKGAIFRGNCEMPEDKKGPDVKAAPKAVPQPDRTGAAKATSPEPAETKPKQP
jgi:cytoskeletal protein CcmA (bactofilin family)